MTAGADRVPAASCSARGSRWTVASLTIRVLVVDDQSMVRAGLRMLLDGEPDIEVVAEAGNGLEAIAQAARCRPDVVLMDIRMPELDGLEATRRILAADAAARVLILTTFNLDEYVYEALRGGGERLRAQGRPTRAADRRRSAPSPPATRCSRPSVTRRVIAHFTRRAPTTAAAARSDTLTDREMDVFRLIAAGLSNAEIGRELFISDTTVKTHVTRLLQKLEVRDRAQAIVLAYQTGLFETDDAS